jgi:hypothetical protein
VYRLILHFHLGAALILALLLSALTAPARAEEEPPPAMVSQEGGLVLLGAPPRAALLVDGQRKAVTPLSGPLRLPVGEHAVQLRRAGYRPFEGSIQIVADRVVALEIEMPRIAGVLVLNVQGAGARVYLDGTPRGEAPIELEVSQGPHQVRVHRDGFYEDTFQFEAVLGEETVHDVQLRELPPNVNPYRKLEEKKPWYARWWVWTLAAVGAAGIATAVIVPTTLSARSDCQRLDAEVCFPIQLMPAPTQTPMGLQIRF